ncbi:inositol monophosphatase family protein [Streptomyces collinus]|uniref:inositol monophosphatase family protein n=1 Tax=Streptomyces collinus TaxID=42684 RepID=UPI0036CEFD36
MKKSALQDELRFAKWFAGRAGEQIRRAVGSQTSTAKADGTPVTGTDRAVNDRFIRLASWRFPGDAVLGEEASNSASADASGRTWVIDPIDGTQYFLLGVPVHMVSIALVDRGTPVVAVAHNPSTGECFWATRGGGAFRDGVRLSVSARDGRSEEAIVRGSGVLQSVGDLASGHLLAVDWRSGCRTVPYSTALPTVFTGCKIAEGSWDGDLYDGVGAHDVAAVCLLVREAGGKVTDARGREQRYDTAVSGCVLSNGLIHDDLLRHWSPVGADKALR